MEYNDPARRIFYHCRNVQHLKNEIARVSQVTDVDPTFYLHRYMYVAMTSQQFAHPLEHFGGNEAALAQVILDQVQWMNDLVIDNVSRELQAQSNAQGAYEWDLEYKSGPDPVNRAGVLEPNEARSIKIHMPMAKLPAPAVFSKSVLSQML